jgi:O-antigen biosynthesis protein WbqP
MKRIFDIFFATLLSAAGLWPMLVIAAVVKLTSRGPALYWSERIGKGNAVFRMPKFRTMRAGTPAVATHLLQDAERHITEFGKLLRRSSLDELPQLFSVLTGDMTFVGPRPALFNQLDLIALRTARGVHRLTPGITGWAQINGRDELAIPLKVEFDDHYLRRRSLAMDIRILYQTVFRVAAGKGVAH